MQQPAKVTFLIGLTLQILQCVWATCDVKYIIETGRKVEVTSPMYPSNFPPYQHCFYEFSTVFRQGDVIRVSILDNSLSCDDDNNTLEVFDAFSTRPRNLGRACAGGVTEFTSPKEILYLVFQSGSFDVAKGSGFRLQAEAVPKYTHCYSQQAKVLTAQSEPQEITTPYYPFEVAPGVNCQWLLKSGPGQAVRLEVTHVDMVGSNNCYNFALHVFDGKTPYDDEKLGSVCDKEKAPLTFQSSGRFLFIQFTSGPNVLNSGGGVRLTFLSVSTGPVEMTTDYMVLYVTLGILLGLLVITIVLVLVRCLVLPMRQRANRHHFAPSHRLSSAAMTPVTMTFFHDDPPPPYHPTNPNTAINSNGTGRAKRRPIFYKFLNCFRTSGNPAMRTDANNTHAGNDVVSRNRHGVGSGARSSTDSTLNLINSRISFTDVLRANSEAGEVIMDNPLRASVSNDYQELPDVSTIRSAPRREAEVVDDTEGSIFDDIIEDSNYNDGVVDDDNNPPGEVRNPDTDSDRDEREERQPHTTLTTNGFLGRHGNSPLPPLPPSTLPPSLSTAQSTSLFPHAPSPPPARNANIVSNENDVMNSGSVPSNEASPCFNGTTNGVAQSGILDNDTMKVKGFSQQSSVEVRNSRDACLSRPSLPIPRSSLPSSSSSSRSSNQEANNGLVHCVVTVSASAEQNSSSESSNNNSNNNNNNNSNASSNNNNITTTTTNNNNNSSSSSSNNNNNNNNNNTSSSNNNNRSLADYNDTESGEANNTDRDNKYHHYSVVGVYSHDQDSTSATYIDPCSSSISNSSSRSNSITTTTTTTSNRLRNCNSSSAKDTNVPTSVADDVSGHANLTSSSGIVVSHGQEDNSVCPPSLSHSHSHSSSSSSSSGVYGGASYSYISSSSIGRSNSGIVSSNYGVDNSNSGEEEGNQGFQSSRPNSRTEGVPDTAAQSSNNNNSNIGGSSNISSNSSHNNNRDCSDHDIGASNDSRSTSSGDNAHRHQIVTPMASVDEDGYQIPHLVRIYDRPDQNQEEHDPVYHSLKFHKESS